MKLLQLTGKVRTPRFLVLPEYNIIISRIIFPTMILFSCIFYKNWNQNTLNQLAPNSKNCTVSSCNTGHAHNSPDANSNLHKTTSSTNILYRKVRGIYSPLASRNRASACLDHNQRNLPPCHVQLVARVRSVHQKFSVSWSTRNEKAGEFLNELSYRPGPQTAAPVSEFLGHAGAHLWLPGNDSSWGPLVPYHSETCVSKTPSALLDLRECWQGHKRMKDHVCGTRKSSAN